MGRSDRAGDLCQTVSNRIHHICLFDVDLGESDSFKTEIDSFDVLSGRADKFGEGQYDSR
jgi:hypothetical protein